MSGPWVVVNNYGGVVQWVRIFATQTEAEQYVVQVVQREAESRGELIVADLLDTNETDWTVHDALRVAHRYTEIVDNGDWVLSVHDDPQFSKTKEAA